MCSANSACMLHVYLETNSDFGLYSINWLVFCDCDRSCLQHGTNWVIK